MEKDKRYKKNNKNFIYMQIGVIGSTQDLQYSTKLENIAKELGKEIALSGNILIFGAEKDYDSIPTIAACEARKNGGLTIGITYGKEKNIYNKNSADVIIYSVLERGGGREFVLVNSCDVIIAIAGGSGTLNEMTIAYQLNIPIIAIENTGGWADKMSNQYFDNRKRFKVLSASDTKNALRQAKTFYH